MSDPVTGTGAIIGGGLMGATFFGVITSTDFGVVFGAFAGSVFYVATAANVAVWRLIAYFITSFIVGVLGAGFVGSWIASYANYGKSLDALGAVIISALCIKVLTFMNNQDLNSLLGVLSRLRGGGTNANK